MIIDPITIGSKASVGDTLALMKEYHIGGIPVVDKSNRLKGIVTNRDLRFEKDMAQPIAKIMTKKSLPLPNLPILKKQPKYCNNIK